MQLFHDWKNPPKSYCVHLLLRSHSAFRPATGNALSGQLSEAAVLGRSAIEYAAYGFYLSRKPALLATWSDRARSEIDRKAAKKAFRMAKIMGEIQGVDLELFSAFQQLYESLIDEGAHPNEPAVRTSRVEEEYDSYIMHGQIYLHGSPELIRPSLEPITYCGICALDLSGFVFEERFTETGVAAHLADLRQSI